MANQIVLYISAASDLQAERDLLGRAVAEIPTTLGWRTVFSPEGNGLVDMEAVMNADVHLLLLGGDIRAPIGLEWLLARRAGRMPCLFLKQGIRRTAAAERFIRDVAVDVKWTPFGDDDNLRRTVLRILADHILDRAVHYILTPEEMARLEAWHSDLDKPSSPADAYGGTGESSVILSRERFMPRNGVLIEIKRENEPDNES